MQPVLKSCVMPTFGEKANGTSTQPVQAHTHPVYSLSCDSFADTRHLVSASTDGLVCVWSLDLLARPQEMILLKREPNAGRTDEVSVSCLDLPDAAENTHIWVGTQDGSIQRVIRSDRANSKAGLDSSALYSGHTSAVTALHFHPRSASKVSADQTEEAIMHDLFLSASFDWSLCLWRSSAKSQEKAPNTGSTIEPLHIMHGGSDAIYDVQWSPQNDSLFAAVDGAGKLLLWDLSVSPDVPIVIEEVMHECALTSVKWSADGQYLFIGDEAGMLSYYAIGEEVSFSPFQIDLKHALMVIKLSNYDAAKQESFMRNLKYMASMPPMNR